MMERPLVGVGVLVVAGGKLLLGERIGAHGSGTWCPSGGHLEHGEQPEECAARELLEETGLVASTVVPGPWTNDYFAQERRHYITLFMVVSEFQGEAVVKEPQKCLRWAWFRRDELPAPLFLSLQHLLEQKPEWCRESLAV